MIKVATTLEIDGGILVGHDGSAAAADAVRWAADLARRLGTRLHIVRSWSISSAPKPSTSAAGYVPPMTDFEAALREVRPSTGPWFSSARGVAMFANEGGAYDELVAYFREHPNE